jgi:hypothetical protein
MSARTGGASQGKIAAGGGYALSPHPSERSLLIFLVLATPAITSGILPKAAQASLLRAVQRGAA